MSISQINQSIVVRKELQTEPGVLPVLKKSAFYIYQNVVGSPYELLSGLVAGGGACVALSCVEVLAANPLAIPGGIIATVAAPVACNLLRNSFKPPIWAEYQPGNHLKFSEGGITVQGSEIDLGLSQKTKKSQESYERLNQTIIERVTKDLNSIPDTQGLKISSVSVGLDGIISVQFDGDDSALEYLAEDFSLQDEVKSMRTSLLKILDENLETWVHENKAKIKEKGGDLNQLASCTDATGIIGRLKSDGIIDPKGKTECEDLQKFIKIHKLCTDSLKVGNATTDAALQRLRDFCKKGLDSKVWSILTKGKTGAEKLKIDRALMGATTESEAKNSLEDLGLMSGGVFKDPVLKDWYEKPAGGKDAALENANKAADKILDEFNRDSGIYRWIGRTLGWHSPTVVPRKKDLQKHLDSQLDQDAKCMHAGLESNKLFQVNAGGYSTEKLSLNFIVYRSYYNRIHDADSPKKFENLLGTVHENIQRAMMQGANKKSLTHEEELVCLEALAYAVPFDRGAGYLAYVTRVCETKPSFKNEKKNEDGYLSKAVDFFEESSNLTRYIKREVTSGGWGLISKSKPEEKGFRL